MRLALFFAPLAVLLSTWCFASQINQITLSELESKATYVVLAKVTKIVEEGNQDHVTIEVATFLKDGGKKETSLKGKIETSYTFTLVSRGGLKDFDPALKVGDTGVFFLKPKDQKGQAEKAYWGSIAIFNKNHFK